MLKKWNELTFLRDSLDILNDIKWVSKLLSTLAYRANLNELFMVVLKEMTPFTTVVDTSSIGHF